MIFRGVGLYVDKKSPSYSKTTVLVIVHLQLWVSEKMPCDGWFVITPGTFDKTSRPIVSGGNYGKDPSISIVFP